MYLARHAMHSLYVVHCTFGGHAWAPLSLLDLARQYWCGTVVQHVIHT
jgi:hypothetical protein